VFFGEAFGGAAFDVGAGGRVVAHAGEHDPVEGGVGLPVSSPVEPVAAGPPGGGGQWCGGAEHGERGLRVQPVRVVAGGDEELSGGVGADAEQLDQDRVDLRHQRVDQLIELGDLLGQ